MANTLQGCRDELLELIVIKNKLETVRSKLLPRAIRPTNIKVQVSAEDMFSEILALEMDMEKQVMERCKVIVAHNKRARAAVDALPNWKHRYVLTLYYLTYYSVKGRRGLYTIPMIAQTMNFSEDHVKRIKREGIEKLATI